MLDRSYLSDTILGRVHLDGAIMVRASLHGATLAGAHLDRANLAGANLVGDNLAGAYLARANLDGAYLAGKRPIFQIGPIGSRSAYLVAHLTDKGVALQTGCFTGTVAEFEAKLQAEHGDNKHAQEYRAALQLIKVHADIWGVKEAGEVAA